MHRLLLLAVMPLVLLAACGGDEVATGNTDATVASTESQAPGTTTVDAGADAGVGSPEVIELQSSGSLGFVVLGGMIDGGWCAHLVEDTAGKSAWNEADCTTSTDEASANGVSYSIEAAPSDDTVGVLYGIVPREVAAVVVEFDTDSGTSTTEVGVTPRDEMDGMGSFSVFLRPGSGTPTDLVLLDSSGAELDRIAL